MNFDESKCEKGILCDFEKSRDLHDALIEICKLCGKKVVYYKRDGRINEAKYLRDHRRDVLQPTDRLFWKIYPEARKNIKSVEKMMEKFVEREERKKSLEELKERRKFMRRQAFKGLGKSDKELEVPKFDRKTGLQKI